jgi:hypothetical protein
MSDTPAVIVPSLERMQILFDSRVSMTIHIIYLPIAGVFRLLEISPPS